jgi:uncharacterized protein (TIGR00369 family)
MSVRSVRELFWEMAEGRKPLAPAPSMLGWKFISFDQERSLLRVSYEVRPEFLNIFGTVHGGFVTAMLDETMAGAAVVVLDGQIGQTLELKANFIRVARLGRLFCEGRVVHRGREIFFLDGTLSDTEGKIVATATATARVTELRAAHLEGSPTT